MHSSRLIQLISSGRRTHERRQPPATDSGSAYIGLHLYEEIILGFPLPLRERDRVRGKGAATSLLIQAKNALSCSSAVADRQDREGMAMKDKEVRQSPLRPSVFHCGTRPAVKI